MSILVEERNIQQHLLKTVKKTLFMMMVIGIGTTIMGFSSGGERLSSTLNTAWGQWMANYEEEVPGVRGVLV